MIANLFCRKVNQAIVVGCMIVLAGVLCSCGKKAGFLPNEKKGTTEMTAFVMDEIVKYGGLKTLPSGGPAVGIKEYLYSEDKDGFQVLCDGNKVPVLNSVFQSRFGNPVMVNTNSVGLSAFEYVIGQTGVVATCGLENVTVSGTNRQFTHLNVVRVSALK